MTDITYKIFPASNSKKSRIEVSVLDVVKYEKAIKSLGIGARRSAQFNGWFVPIEHEDTIKRLIKSLGGDPDRQQRDVNGKEIAVEPIPQENAVPAIILSVKDEEPLKKTTRSKKEVDVMPVLVEKPAQVEDKPVPISRVDASRVDANRVDANRVDASRVDASRVDTNRVDASRVDTSRVYKKEVPKAEQSDSDSQSDRSESRHSDSESRHSDSGSRHSDSGSDSESDHSEARSSPPKSSNRTVSSNAVPKDKKPLRSPRKQETRNLSYDVKYSSSKLRFYESLGKTHFPDVTDSSSDYSDSSDDFPQPSPSPLKTKRDIPRFRDERPREDRGREERPREGRGREERPREDRGREERPREDRGREERPREDRGREERPREERPRENRPREERPREDRVREERPREDRGREERPRPRTPQKRISPRRR